MESGRKEAQVVEKVVAYITREGARGRELLVFVHRDVPEARVQVPAGTVQAGEAIESALFREVREESGLEDLRLVRKLAVYDWYSPEHQQTHRRHVFHLAAPGDLPASWEGAEGAPGEENYWIFDFYWLPLDGAIELAGDQGAWLGAL